MFLSYAALGVYYLNLFASSFEGDRLWSEFKMNFNKTYSQHEEIKRRMIFEENLKSLRFHNAKSLTHLSTFRMGINELSDITFDEFKSVHSFDGNTKLTDEHIDARLLNSELRKFSDFVYDTEIPKSFDWRDHMKITNVKNQEKCGSCYAFAAVGVVESLIYRQTSKLIDLSEQEIIDCGRGYFLAGCQGGYEIGALNYIIDHGISYENEYPYTGKKGHCRRNETTMRYKADFGKILTPKFNTEESLLRQLLLFGPSVISIDHVHESFMRYSSGIWYESDCNEKNRETTHIMLLVGYGSEKGEDYWTVKNSLGNSWGENGYMRMSRNKNSHCGIANEPISIYSSDFPMNKTD